MALIVKRLLREARRRVRGAGAAVIIPGKTKRHVDSRLWARRNSAAAKNDHTGALTRPAREQAKPRWPTVPLSRAGERRSRHREDNQTSGGAESDRGRPTWHEIEIGRNRQLIGNDRERLDPADIAKSCRARAARRDEGKRHLHRSPPTWRRREGISDVIELSLRLMGRNKWRRIVVIIDGRRRNSSVALQAWPYRPLKLRHQATLEGAHGRHLSIGKWHLYSASEIIPCRR